MSEESRPMRELVVLVPDKHTQVTISGILGRHHALGIKYIDYKVYVHPGRDGGCLSRGCEFLRPFVSHFRHALVVFDREGCGKDHQDRTALESALEQQLSRAGWAQRAAVVVLDPELEVWVWSDSPQVCRILGWEADMNSLKGWLVERGFLTPGSIKPRRPKEAMLELLRLGRRPHSSSIFQELARTVSLERCQDPAFQKVKLTLIKWFPSSSETE